MKGIFHITFFKLIHQHADLTGVKTKAQFMLYVNDNGIPATVLSKIMYKSKVNLLSFCTLYYENHDKYNFTLRVLI